MIWWILCDLALTVGAGASLGLFLSEFRTWGWSDMTPEQKGWGLLGLILLAGAVVWVLNTPLWAESLAIAWLITLVDLALAALAFRYTPRIFQVA